MPSPSVPPGFLVEGQTLAGKYRVARKLGSGGMCIVYEAEHIHLRSAVAIKLLKPDLAKDPTAVARFAQEAQAAAKLRSLNVARVHDVDRLADGQPYITMELLVGHDLGNELEKKFALPVVTAVDYVRQAASGITEAHVLGIVHRDLKPENLFLSDLGEETDRRLVKILDFGIAKNIRDSARKLTAPDAVFGTVDYMSPEQIRSAATVDHRTDLWSLGVILYELLTGRTPYSGDARSVIAQIVSDPVPPPSRFVPTLPSGLVSVVMKALAKDPKARFQSAEELRQALVPFSGGLEPIETVIAKLTPGSVPRRNEATPIGLPAPRELRAGTNLSFESSARRKAWQRSPVAVPALGLTFVALLGGALWFSQARVAREAPAAPPPPPVLLSPPPTPDSTGLPGLAPTDLPPAVDPSALAAPPPLVAPSLPSPPDPPPSRPKTRPKPPPHAAPAPAPAPAPLPATTNPKHI